jgi:hypothetical protein
VRLEGLGKLKNPVISSLFLRLPPPMRIRVSSLSVFSRLADKEECMDDVITVAMKMYCVEVMPPSFIPSS